MTEQPRRRRRSPEVAEREIIAAAEELLRERPFRDLTVDEVMRRTELSRPSFYVYFRDRHQLVLRVVERLGAEMWTMSERWFEGTGPGGACVLPRGARGRRRGVRPARSRPARAGGRRDGRPRGRASPTPRSCRRFIDATATHIEDEIEAGRILPLDAARDGAGAVPDERRAISSPRSGGRGPRTPETVVETLATIWTRTLYGARLVQLAAEPDPEQRRAAGDQPDAGDRERREVVAGLQRGGEIGRVGEDPGQHPRPGAVALARRVGGAEPDREVARAERPDRDLGGGTARVPPEPAVARRAPERASGRRRRGRGRGPARGRSSGRPLSA